MFKRFVLLFLLISACGLYSVNAQEKGFQGFVLKGFQGCVETKTSVLLGGGFDFGASLIGGYRYGAHFVGLGIGYDFWQSVPVFVNYKCYIRDMGSFVTIMDISAGSDLSELVNGNGPMYSYFAEGCFGFSYSLFNNFCLLGGIGLTVMGGGNSFSLGPSLKLGFSF